MIKIKVSASTNYFVNIGENLYENLGERFSEIIKPCKVLVVTDENVAPLYLKQVTESLKKSGYKPFSAIIEAGESSKSIDTFAYVLEMCATINLNRGDLLVALGGGVIGDLVGFSASAYMRGINFIQLPTSLLASIDSSVGGKTAVNIKQGKNLVGAFYQPIGVFYNTDTFKTLPEKEVLCGLGEAIKYAVLCGGEIYDILNEGLSDKNLMRLCQLCVMAKAKIVEKDERESGERKLLNLGHTIAHAIEKLSGYKISHGVAVAKGLYIIMKAQLSQGQISNQCFLAVENLLKKYNINLDNDYPLEQIAEQVVFDKKATAKGIDAVLVKDIGSCYVKNISFSEFKEFLLCS